MNIIQFNNKNYPAFQAEGNASQFAIPFAKHFCSGRGVDIGFSNPEWKYPGAIGVDLDDDSNDYHAMNLPKDLDYIFSSHCLEHILNWVGALEYWSLCLKPGGTLFLYLPHKNQEYWHPWNNRKHYHVLEADMVVACLERFGFKNVFYSDRDLNDSFMIVGEKI